MIKPIQIVAVVFTSIIWIITMIRSYKRPRLIGSFRIATIAFLLAILSLRMTL